MAKKVNDVVKAFGKDIEEATKKLQSKLTGFCILHPEFAGAALEYDAGTFTKDGKEMAWAKLFQYVEEEEEPVANHPEVAAPKKGRRKKNVKVA